MKIRQGFVSNSSSSSFIVGCKGKLTKEKLMKVFKVDKNSIFYTVAEKVSEQIVENSIPTTVEKYIEDYGSGYLDDTIKKVIKKEFTLYGGSACDEESSYEAVLCDMELDYEDDEIIIKKEGGY